MLHKNKCKKIDNFKNKYYNSFILGNILCCVIKLCMVFCVENS